MLFTLGEMIIVIIAFILITYYIFSVKLCKDDKINEEFIEDMNGNLSNRTVIMRINEENENYYIFKEILDINNYKTYNRKNINIWVPFFAYDILLYDNDIENAKYIKDSNKIFLEVLYPKILLRSLEIIEIINKIKIIFDKEQIIFNSCDIYIKYIQSYLMLMLSFYINKNIPDELESLQRNEEKIIKIHTLLINLSTNKIN